MIDRLQAAFVFGIYQLSVLIGILLLPVALLARRAGLTVPMGRAIARLGDAYDRVRGHAG